MYSDAVRHCRDAYNSMISKGVAPEQARAVLPQGMFTEWVETGSLAAAARIVGLRNKEDAQKEVQDLAIMLKNDIEPIAPVSWKALTC